MHATLSLSLALGLAATAFAAPATKTIHDGPFYLHASGKLYNSTVGDFSFAAREPKVIDNQSVASALLEDPRFGSGLKCHYEATRRQFDHQKGAIWCLIEGHSYGLTLKDTPDLTVSQVTLVEDSATYAFDLGASMEVVAVYGGLNEKVWWACRDSEPTSHPYPKYDLYYGTDVASVNLPRADCVDIKLETTFLKDLSS